MRTVHLLPQPLLHHPAHQRGVRVAAGLANDLADEEAEEARLAGAVLVGLGGVGGDHLVHDGAWAPGSLTVTYGLAYSRAAASQLRCIRIRLVCSIGQFRRGGS